MNSKIADGAPPAPSPVLSSAALTRCLAAHGAADHVDVIAVPVPAGAPQDPAWFARRAFSAQGVPCWVGVLLTARQALVPLIGLKPSPADTMRVREVVDDEALIEASEKHLDFWLAVAVDPLRGDEPRFLRATTVVKLHGWRGRLYWGVVQAFHGPVTSAILRRIAHGG